MLITAIWSKELFKALLTLFGWSIDSRQGVFSSPTVTVFLSVSPFSSVSSCFIYFTADKCYILHYSHYYYKMSISVSLPFLSWNVFVRYNNNKYTTPIFLWIPFAWSIIFHPFTLSLCLSLKLRCVSWRHPPYTLALFFDPNATLSFYWWLQSRYM